MTKLFSVLSIFLFLIPTILNRFPLVYYDTGFYLFYAKNTLYESSFLFRPLAYSALVAFSHSLFLLILVQSAWLSLLIERTSKIMELDRRIYFLVIFLSVLLTPIAIYSNFIMPDIFFAIQFLALFNLFHEKSGFAWKWFYGFSLIFASMVHYSNLVLCAALFLIALILMLIQKSRQKIVFLFLIPILILPAVHFARFNQFTLTNSAYFYLFSRLQALDISQSFLEEKCKTEDLKLCLVLKDGFNPWDWSSHGSIKRLGGLPVLQAELRKVCNEVFHRRALVLEFLRKSSLNILKQFIYFSKPPEATPNDHSVKDTLILYSEFEKAQFESQTLKKYEPEHIENVRHILEELYFMIIVISFFIFVLLYKKLSVAQNNFFELLMGVLILNAIICGSLTEPADRYQGRLIFLFPLFIIYILLNRWLGKGKLRHTPGND